MAFEDYDGVEAEASAVDTAAETDSAELAAPQSEDTTTETAEETDNEGAPETEVETAETPAEQPQQTDNAVWAAARKRAEAEAERKYNARFEQQMAALNQQFASTFANSKNPATGKPIQSAEDYLAAIQAQRDAAMRQKFRDAGIDNAQQMIDEAVSRNPAVIQAQQILAQQRDEEGMRRFNEGMAIIARDYDDTIKTFEDLHALPEYNEIAGYVENGMSLDKAFKIARLDSILAKKTAATKQAAINSAKGKDHMPTTSGKAVTAEGGVPAEQMAFYREQFPGKTDKQLNELWRMTHKK